MTSKDEGARVSYAVDRLGIFEIGPGSMANLLLDHMTFISNKPVMMIGEPGIGKTAITYQLENSKKFHVLTIRLANEDEGTMNGYADPDPGKKTVTLRVVRKVVEAAEAAKAEGKQLIIFFDEVNRAKDHMIKTVFNIIDTFRWGDYELPKNTAFISAINPPTKNHKVRDVLSDSALRRRFALYACKADAGEYLTYAKEANIHPAVISFLTSKPKWIYDYEALDNGRPYACPATWDSISRILYGYENRGGALKNVSKDVNVERMITGAVGQALSYEFLTYAEDLSKRFAPQNILNNYLDIRNEVKECVNSEFTEEDADLDLSKMTGIVQNLAIYLADKLVNTGMRFHVSEQDRKDHNINAKDAKKFNKQGHNLARFLSDCPAELFHSFFEYLSKEVKAIAKNGREGDYTSYTSQLTHYKEYMDKCESFMNTRDEANKARS